MANAMAKWGLFGPCVGSNKIKTSQFLVTIIGCVTIGFSALLLSPPGLAETLSTTSVSGDREESGLVKDPSLISTTAKQTSGSTGDTTSHNTSSLSANKILVKFKTSADKMAVASLRDSIGGNTSYTAKSVPGLQVIILEPGEKIEDVLAIYNSDPLVEYAEPDQRVFLRETLPNESLFDELWGLHNTGQVGGLADADINAPQAWDITTGSDNVVVAVVDTGIDYSHIDLIDNMWVNPGEIPANGIDDDGNGHVDDIHGIDTGDDDSDPMDDIDHGTHVAGTIGATGNNVEGITGVSWNVKMIACKIFSGFGQQLEAFVSDAIECLDYLYDLKVNRGIDIIATNNSWGWVGNRSQALYEAILRQADAGILFIASAGNDTINTDAIRDFPSTYYSANLISIAATGRSDTLATFSNYGRRSVHIGAPGVSILSTIPGGAQFVPPDVNPHSNIFLDDAEGGTGEWIVDAPWTIGDEEFFSGSSSWTDSPESDYALNSITTLTSPSIDLTPWSTEPIYLGVYTKYFLEEGFDFVDVQVSSNDGVSWVPIGRYTGFSPSWEFFSYLVPSSFYTDSFRMRFSLVSDSIIAADGIYLDDIGIGTTPYEPVQESGSTALSFKSGTSMASPHVTGLLALLKAQDPTRSWSQLKNLVISSGTPLASLTTNTVSGRRLRAADDNGIGGLTCSEQTVLARLKPLMDAVVVETEGTLDVSMLHITCGEPAGNITVILEETGAITQLSDDGLGFDQFAGDGIYSAQLDFAGTGLSTATLLFPDESTVNVKLVKNYLPGRVIPNQWRDIAAVRKLVFSGDDALHFVDSPFPVAFPGEQTGFDRLVVSSNGHIMPRRIDEFSAIYPYPENTALPTLLYQRLVAPYWDDLTAYNSGNLSWGVLGTEPNRELVVEWSDVKHFNHNLDGISFQAVFFEGSTDILFNYEDTDFDNTSIALDLSNGASATVGIQISQRVSQQYSFDSPLIESDTSLLFSINNFPPQLDRIDNQSSIEGLDIFFQVNAADDNVIDPLLSITGLPDGAHFNEQTGEFSWENVGPPGSYPVTVTATDIADPTLVTEQSFVIDIEQNLPPVIAPVPDLDIPPGSALAIPLDISDPNHTPVYINVMELPGDAYFDELTGTIHWDSAEEGQYEIVVIAVDSINAMLVDFIYFTLDVAPVIENVAPQLFAINDQAIIEGDSIRFTVTANDSDTTQPLLNVIGLPPGAAFYPDVGLFIWDDAGPAGDYNITVVATDSQDHQLTDEQQVNIHIEQNHPPQIDVIDNQYVLEGDAITVALQVSDANDTPAVIKVIGLPEGAVYLPSTQEVNWGSAEMGQYEITVVAADAIKPSLIAAESFSVSVVAPVINVAPEITPMEDVLSVEGQQIDLQVIVFDGNFTQPSLSIAGLPEGADFNTRSGLLRWPNAGPVGAYSVTVIATDAEDPALQVSSTINIVIEQNLAPEITFIEDMLVTSGVAIEVPIIVADPNSSDVYMHVIGLPEGASFSNGSQALIAWPEPVAGEYTITVLATDSIDPAMVTSQSFKLIVEAAPGEKGSDTVSGNTRKKGGGSFSLLCLLLAFFHLWRVTKYREVSAREISLNS